ncbi:MAG TPA: penicillin acylase family protein [Pyrinomonadaceae bacterium]|nr:penicillin acylase family protein [Pyrinomonadaceae bacterium]
MKKIINLFNIILVLLFFAFVSFGQVSSQQLKIEGLKQSVTVRKDGRGIPYIEAQNEEDLYFAQGFITAQDRLFQMDMLRRVARGETAEIYGKVTVEEDKRWRKFGFAKIVETAFNGTESNFKSALENYAKGVNAYIATLDAKSFPVEYQILQFTPRPWLPTDSMIIGKILADGLSTTWQNDLMRANFQKILSPEKYKDATNGITPYDVILFGKDSGNSQNQKSKTQSRVDVSDNDLQMAENEAKVRQSSLERVGLYAEELAASNNWVISGKRTADGKPILANDPHLPPTAPGIWYLAHLSTPNLRISGVALPGSPGIVLGHNDSIVWGATNVGPDVQDLYLETFNADGKYKTPNGWEAPTIRKEEIKVRKSPTSTETETVSLDVIETKNGVIYTEDGGNKFALKWTARDPKNQEFEAFYLLNRAKNWEDFKNALKTYGGSTQNFVYADVKGNIGWIAAGRIPLRKTGEGAFPYDGSTNDGDWTGYIPFEELPQLYNPPQGFIVTANQRIVGTNYKYQQISRDTALPWRARRITTLLDVKEKITMDKVGEIQFDVYNFPFAELAKEMLKFNVLSPNSTQILTNWNGKMTPDSEAALWVNEIRNCLAGKISDDNKGIPTFVVREKLLWWIIKEKSTLWLPKQYSDYGAFIKACEAESQESLNKRFGNDKSKMVWGSVFTARFPHPLASVPFVGGQFATPNSGINGSGQTPNVGSNVSMRHIASPGNWDATRHVIPLGESGNPKSPFWKDQFEAWSSGKSPVFPFSKSAVEASAKETWVLQPK